MSDGNRPPQRHMADAPRTADEAAAKGETPRPMTETAAIAGDRDAAGNTPVSAPHRPARPSGVEHPSPYGSDEVSFRGLDRESRPVSVVVFSDDFLLEQGASAYLGVHPEVEVLPSGMLPEAQVALVIVDVVTDETIGLIEYITSLAPAGPLTILIGDLLYRHHVLRAIDAGLAGVIPRRGAAFEHVLAAIMGLRKGSLRLPGEVLASMKSWLNSMESQALEPLGLTLSGLHKREIEVIRLLAEGLSTREIAEQLNYSERTVKNIIHGTLSRLNLRNRVQAVAFAIRSGVL